MNTSTQTTQTNEQTEKETLLQILAGLNALQEYAKQHGVKITCTADTLYNNISVKIRKAVNTRSGATVYVEHEKMISAHTAARDTEYFAFIIRHAVIELEDKASRYIKDEEARLANGYR